MSDSECKWMEMSDSCTRNWESYILVPFFEFACNICFCYFTSSCIKVEHKLSFEIIYGFSKCLFFFYGKVLHPLEKCSKFSSFPKNTIFIFYKMSLGIHRSKICKSMSFECFERRVHDLYLKWHNYVFVGLLCILSRY